MARQNQWRWCQKCEGFFFSGNPTEGACPAGGVHDPSQSGNYAAFLGESVPGAQGNWQWCQKCEGLFFSGNPGQGRCPAGGAHDGGASGSYSLLFGDQVNGAQDGWRWCQKCAGLFFSGNPDRGHCPAGGAHDDGASGHYVVLWEVARSPQIALQTGPIVFGGGVPVGGWSNLTLSPDGTFDFTGHFHNSGFVGFDASVGWLLKSATGTAFTWAAGGSMGGFGGDRDFNWNNSGKNAAIADAWDDLSAGCWWEWQAKSGLDLGGIIKELESVVGTIVQVIAVVGPLLARPPRPR
jgi:hypothetical protein